MVNSLTGYKYWQLSYWSATWRQMPLEQRNRFRLVMLLHFVLAAWFTFYQDPLWDEGEYFGYLVRWAKGHAERTYPLMDSKTPMLAAGLIPAMFKQWLPESLIQNDLFFYMKAGRPFLYPYQLLGCYVVFCWLYRLWGAKRWLLPFLFFCFEPLIFSYSMFIASDLPSAAVLVTLMYTLWRFTATHQQKYWWIACIAFSWGLLLKSSFIFCLPLMAILFLIKAIEKKQWNWKKALIQTIQLGAVMLLMVNLVYYFQGFGKPLGDMHFQSQLFSGLQQRLAFAKNWPIPLPEALIQSFDWLQRNGEYGGCREESSYNGVWLWGKVSCNKPVWYYYLVVAMYKMPLLFWGLVLAFAVYFFTRKNIIIRLKKHAFIWLPFVYFLLILSFLSKFQIGIRHAILLLPFVYIGISGTIIAFWEKKRWLFVVLIALHTISVLRFCPNLLSYTNELVWNKSQVNDIMIDSSVDYGQMNYKLKEFFKKHTDYTAPPSHPQAGKYAITISDLMNPYLGIPGVDYGWLRMNFKPVGNYYYTVLLFEITPEDLKSRGL